MNTWTISRRIIVGFATVLLITAALGAFALWRLQSISKNLGQLADNTLRSVLTLNECASLSRDNIFTAQQFILAESEARRTELEQQIAQNRARIDELIRQYEGLISDSEDRRLFEEAKQTRLAFATARTRLLELVRQNKVEEHRKWLNDVVVPAYEASIKAIQADVDYNNRLGMMAGEAGKSAANSSVRLIRIALVFALVLNGLMAWQVAHSTNRVLRELATQLDQGSIQTAAAARQVSASSQTLSAGSSEQAASVEETSASLEEMSAMIRATAENAQKAKGLAGEARAVAEAGSRTMIEMNQAMAAIDSSSAEVAKIVKNIDEIAFQTNILALNAAVEAAIASSRQGSRSCTRVGESLTQIADKVTSTDSLVAEMATAAREQAQGIEQINVAITQMDKVTQSNSASAEESASAAEELDAQAESLKDMVGQLRQLVGGAGVSSAVAPGPGSRYTVSNAPAAHPARARPRVSKTLAGNGRKAIPMPGDSNTGTGGDDENFRNF